MSSRKKALEAFKRSKDQRLQGISQINEYEVKDVDNIYDEISEDQFVQEQNEAHDFVVDDDGLGYNDDGEEVIYGVDPNSRKANDRNRNRLTSNKKNLTIEALKKKRRMTALLREDEINHVPKGNRSMFEFLNANKQQRGGGGSSKLKEKEENTNNGVAETSLDDLLNGLDGPSSRSNRRAMAKGRRNGKSSRFETPVRRTYGRNKYSTPAVAANARLRNNTKRWETSPLETQPPIDEEEEDQGMAPMQVDDEFDTQPPAPQKPEKSLNTIENIESDESHANEVNPTPRKIEDDFTPQLPTKKPRTKLRGLSAAAKAALAKKEEPKVEEPAAHATLPKPDAALLPVNTTPTAPTVSISNDILSEIVQEVEGEEETKRYLDLFWIDAHENKGAVTLFGKVHLPSQKSFVSCAITVTNNVRNLYVLPRTIDNEPAPMIDIHKEINSILKPRIIPDVTGASWAGKVVQRNYAFEDTSIPKEPTDYFKVVYDAKYPSIPQDICENGGKSFSKILGWSSSVLETFIVKRELMGPCWLRIYNPTLITLPTTWCSLEFQIDTPKDVIRLDLKQESKTPPPLVVASLKLQTIVNPTTHKSEIVAVSAICHNQVQLESDTKEAENITHVTMIRPIHNNNFPRDIDAACRTVSNLQRQCNERALLNCLMAQIGRWDPDVIVGHNSLGFDMELLLSRCKENKVAFWSKLGRRRQMSNTSFKLHNNFIPEAVCGRIICDTYLSAKELLQGESLYSLTHLAKTQLNVDRVDIDPMDIPSYFQNGPTVIQLVQHTLLDAHFILRLMLKLQTLPLTRQLTCIAGNLWSKTIRGNRADRNEYLLLHEFYKLDYIVPEKKKTKEKMGKYSGGLVLEPKKGLYDSYILLLDFNSLYPSIIQEYNLCFSTLEWASIQQQQLLKQKAPKKNAKAQDVNQEQDNEDHVAPEHTDALPALPTETTEGILPRVIKTLVERRKNVKRLLKNEKNNNKKQELNIRQLALKLTANSMYGCLGFSNSRFYAQPIAALVTAMGREALQRTVDIAQNTLNLEVIYGDTDSIMINTHLKSQSDLPAVKEMAVKVKKEVNRLYRTLELEMDGIFQSMLLLKKKKYAALTVQESPDGTVTIGKEFKGLDLVRRDWCPLSKEAGIFVLDQILSGKEREDVIHQIHDYLEDLANKMREGEIPLEKYIIIKGLNKHPNDYPDAKSLPHVHVAKWMIKNSKVVNAGDHIPYVIAPLEDKETKVPIAERAKHPDEMQRNNLKPDIEWYLAQQILPPIGRLCQPVEGMSQAVLAEKLGLDASKFNNTAMKHIEEENNEDYIPMSCLPDKERFMDAEKLSIKCASCKQSNEFIGVNALLKDQNIFDCPNPECTKPKFWGLPNLISCLVRIDDAVTRMYRRHTAKYYEGTVVCDDTTCALETRQLSVCGSKCLVPHCNGKLQPKYSSKAIYTQLKYLDTLFDMTHVLKQIELRHVPSNLKKQLEIITVDQKEGLEVIRDRTRNYLEDCGYHWVGSDFFGALFGKAQ